MTAATLDAAEAGPSPNDRYQPPRVGGAIVYTLFVGVATYAIAAYASVQDTAETAFEISQNRNPFGDLLSYVGSTPSTATGRVSEEQMWAAKQHKKAQRLGRGLKWLMDVCDSLHLSRDTKKVVGETYTSMAEKYLNLPQTKEVMVPLLASHAAIFLLLNIGLRAGRRSNQSMIVNLFTNVPSRNRSITLTTAAFAHIGLFHLCFNSYAMWTFDTAALRAPRFLADEHGRIAHTPEASLLPHFLAFFIVSGTFASLCSQIASKLMFASVRQRAGYQAAIQRVGRLPGLGASGAAYAMVTLFALAFRNESEISIVFLPIKAESLTFVKCLTSVEFCLMVASIVLGRHLFMVDHSAHLGGALFGYFYYHYGNALWEKSKRAAYIAYTDSREVGSAKAPQFSSSGPAIAGKPSEDVHNRPSSRPGRLV